MSPEMSESKSSNRALRGLSRELLLPLLVLLGVLLLAVALVDGKPLDPFLYAVF